MSNEFEPKKNILERYGIQSLTYEDKQRLDELSKTKIELLQKYLNKIKDELPEKIKLTGFGGIIEFSLTAKREIKYPPKNGSFIEDLDENYLMVEKLEDNVVFYQSEWGWGVFVDIDKMETICYDGSQWGGQKIEVYE
jgi:hypothetical protein